MKTQNIVKFPSEVIEKIGFYVYRLIDPRDGSTFYVGKGKGNRVFAHIAGEENYDSGKYNLDAIDDKMNVIREIKRKNLEVIHVIHRHGMDERTAEVVEAALIDAYPGLSNDQTGKGNSEVGVMNVKELIEKYKADEVVFKHRCLIISVNQSSRNMNLLDATRFAWKVNLGKAKRAELVLAVIKGIVRGVYRPKEWLAATIENFPQFNDEIPERYAFNGEEVEENLKSIYLDKRIPDTMRKRGASNPIRYSY